MGGRERLAKKPIFSISPSLILWYKDFFGGVWSDTLASMPVSEQKCTSSKVGLDKSLLVETLLSQKLEKFC